MKNKHLFRTGWNNLLQGVIRLCMLSAVAFTVTACYAPAPCDPDCEPWTPNDTTERAEQRRELEQRLASVAEDIEATTHHAE